MLVEVSRNTCILRRRRGERALLCRTATSFTADKDEAEGSVEVATLQWANWAVAEQRFALSASLSARRHFCRTPRVLALLSAHALVSASDGTDNHPLSLPRTRCPSPIALHRSPSSWHPGLATGCPLARPRRVLTICSERSRSSPTSMSCRRPPPLPPRRGGSLVGSNAEHLL